MFTATVARCDIQPYLTWAWKDPGEDNLLGRRGGGGQERADRADSEEHEHHTLHGSTLFLIAGGGSTLNP
ncbi:MAG: hypothetical protein DMF90_03030, partial [Acidobacteria bacterium]